MGKYCRDCGTKLNEETNKCPKCDETSKKEESIQSKSRLKAGLLGIFLGGLGFHNFYLGNTGRGISQIIVTFCTCFTGFVWGFVEGVLILIGQINEYYYCNKLV